MVARAVGYSCRTPRRLRSPSQSRFDARRIARGEPERRAEPVAPRMRVHDKGLSIRRAQRPLRAPRVALPGRCVHMTNVSRLANYSQFHWSFVASESPQPGRNTVHCVAVRSPHAARVEASRARVAQERNENEHEVDSTLRRRFCGRNGHGRLCSLAPSGNQARRAAARVHRGCPWAGVDGAHDSAR
jgi:hypothetical protein